MKGFLIPKCFSNIPECRVSSAAIRSTDFRISSARNVISARSPIGVASTYSIAYHRIKIGLPPLIAGKSLGSNKANRLPRNESLREVQDEKTPLPIDVSSIGTDWLRGRTNDGDNDYDYAAGDNDRSGSRGSRDQTSATG